jgi:hypothetical protein
MGAISGLHFQHMFSIDEHSISPDRDEVNGFASRARGVARSQVFEDRRPHGYRRMARGCVSFSEMSQTPIPINPAPTSESLFGWALNAKGESRRSFAKRII